MWFGEEHQMASDHGRFEDGLLNRFRRSDVASIGKVVSYNKREEDALLVYETTFSIDATLL